MNQAFEWIGESQQATGEVAMSVATQFEHGWLYAALQPDPAPHDSFDAIIDFAAHQAVVNSEGHDSTRS